MDSAKIKGGQSSLEFLVTSGLVVLVITIAVVVVWQTGVLQPAPCDRCKTAFSQVVPIDWVAYRDTNTLVLSVENRAAYRINVTQVYATVGDVTCASALGVMTGSGDKIRILLNCSGASTLSDKYMVRDCYRADVMITYVNTNTGSSHESIGEIRGEIEGGTIAVTSTTSTSSTSTTSTSSTSTSSTSSSTTTTIIPVPPGADNLSVEDVNGSTGDHVLVPVNINNVQDGSIAGISFNISYNSSVMLVVGLQAGSLTPGWDIFNAYKNHLWGARVSIVYGGAGTEIAVGSTGSVVLLNFSVIGNPGETSYMNLDDILLSDSLGNLGTVPVDNGTFTVT